MDFQNEIGDLQRKITQCQEGIARRRTMFESLVVESGQTILDLGCGGGHLVHELALANCMLDVPRLPRCGEFLDLQSFHPARPGNRRLDFQGYRPSAL